MFKNKKPTHSILDDAMPKGDVQKAEKPSDILLGKMPKSIYLRQSELIPNIVPFSSATLWRKVNSGEFPKPYKLSARVTAWLTAEIADYLDKIHQATKA